MLFKYLLLCSINLNFLMSEDWSLSQWPCKKTAQFSFGFGLWCIVVVIGEVFWVFFFVFSRSSVKCSFWTFRWWKAAKFCIAQRLPPDSSVVSVLSEAGIDLQQSIGLVLKERLMEFASFLEKAICLWLTYLIRAIK